jgi:8-amino-7-oxononanoate synthase
MAENIGEPFPASSTWNNAGKDVGELLLASSTWNNAGALTTFTDRLLSPALMSSPLDSIREELAALEAAGLRRRMRPIDSAQSAEITVDGRRCINFSSNNYLGLADDPRLAMAATQAMVEHGVGAAASRLVSGSLMPHRALEQQLAHWQNTEAALLFNSGYQANVGLVSALVGPGDVVFSDALNHASIIDGCRLSRAQVVIYRHNDITHLETLLQTHGGRRRLIVTDSVFSMDGDRAPLEDIGAIAHRNEALWAVDDAHAIGVYGTAGAGLSRGLPIDVRMGTFGKALGSFGAFVAGSAPIVELIFQRARSFIFTTALPIPVVAAASRAVVLMQEPEAQARRKRLQHHANFLHGELQRRGFLLPSTPSHILPIRVKDGTPQSAMRASDALLARGLFVQGIRPPTVPVGTARLRLTLMATHTEAQLAHALQAFEELSSFFATPGEGH